MRRLLAALALSLTFALGFTPCLALAGDGNLTAVNTNLTIQTDVNAPSSNGLAVTSPVYLGTGQKAKFTAVADKTYMGSVSSHFNWNASYYGVFTILKGGKTLATKRVNLSAGSADKYLWYEGTCSYKPKTAGTYKVRFQFMDGSSEMDSYERTFKVQKVSKLKSYKPACDVEIGYVKSTDKQYPMISGLNGKTQIYRATKKGGKYKLIATTTKATYTDKKANAGKEFWYKTRVIGKSGKKTYKSKLSAAKSEPLLYAPPKVPTIKSATAVYNGVKLKWNKTSSPFGCSYYVFRSTKEVGGYAKIAEVRQDYDGTLYADGGEILDNSAFVDTSALDGQTYYYKMGASYSLKWNQKVASSTPVRVTT